MALDMWQLVSQEISKCDYVRWGFADLHGVMRGKIIPGRHCERFIKHGKGAYAGILTLGPANEDTVMPELERRNFGNGYLKPDLDTFHLIPWCGGANVRVGELLCSFYWSDGSPVLADPRHTALRQLNRLDAQGLHIKSAFEYEFRLFKPNTFEPIAQRFDSCSIFLLQQNQDFLFDLERYLLEAGVDLEAIHSEYGCGQYEATMTPLIGIVGADKAMIYREGVREIAGLHKMTASFMGKPFFGESASGCHFNHSLWTSDNNNVFYDPAQENGMSDILKYWIGGQLAHAAALTALFSPTVNCYRRLHQPWAPDYVDWGIDDRKSAYRLVSGAEKNTYLENRQPSSCANPYIVFAATIAAGLDGIQRKLEPSLPSSRGQGRLPYSLNEALQALQNDTIIVEALGKDFIEWFVETKKQSDLKKFIHHDMHSMIDSEIEAERKEYLIYM